MKPNFDRPLPVLPLRNSHLFPGVTLSISVGRPISIEAVKATRQEYNNWVIVVTQLNDLPPTPDSLPKVGVLTELKSIEGSDEQGYYVLAQPTERVRIEQFDFSENKFLLASVYALPDIRDLNEKTEQALIDSLKKMADEIIDLLPGNTDQIKKIIDGINDLRLLTHLCSTYLDISLEEKQELLEMVSLKNRTLRLLDLLAQKKDELQVQTEINTRLTHKLGKGQREAILREQLKAIREELGDAETEDELAESYEEKIEKAGMPEDVEKVALDELRRLEAIGNSSPEAHVIRNYLDLLCSIPWSKSANLDIENLDLDKARKILDDDHFGLDKVKKRIVQHLAVMKLKKSSKGSILLLIGPPGVGKTSLGQSIAKALGRKFVRSSLGGVRDDAEIRGHRRTYIGAMPGRIIQGIKRAGENNPVFMLDEIDKLGRGFAGDPAAALLEVLDPEQNSTFLDHYLDVAFDLSRVFFIATANSLEGIPGPLLDRMETIELSGYTTAEKLHIAKRHLIPKVMGEYGIEKDRLIISDSALKSIVNNYTREAGVRDLQRQIAGVARASAEQVLRSEQHPVRVETSDLKELLGSERFQHEVAEKVVAPGVVTGLAWTPHGGDILFIETSLMPGKGKLILTGQLGEVMKESAKIALSLVRSRLAPMLPSFDFDKQDIHLHVPAGAIPKDGPSAGVAILCSIASVFSGRSVDPKMAMTGEITLRGAVTPVGGIKEKVIAAHRAGIERVVLSSKNERDLSDVPEEVRSQIKFELVDRIEDVLRRVLAIDTPEVLRAPTREGTADLNS